MKRILTVALLLIFGLTGVACGGSKQKKADKTAAEQKRAQAAAERAKTEVEEPTQEELSKSPCGNPRWAKLPEGSESKAEDAATEEKDDDAAPSEPESDDTEENDKDREGDC